MVVIMVMLLMVMVMAIVRKEIKSQTKNGDGDHVQLYMLETTNYNLTQIYRSVFTPLFSIRYILNPSLDIVQKYLSVVRWIWTYIKPQA